MRDDNARPARHDALQRILDQGFGFAIERTGGFVQNQNTRVFQNHTRQGDTLFFAAAQTVAALAHDRVVALGERVDERVGFGDACGGDDLVVRGIAPAVGDVLGDRAVEQEHLLADQPDGAAQVLEVKLFHVDPVEAHLATGGVDETQQQLDQGRLARPGRAHDRGRLAGREHEVDAAEDGGLRAVVEADAVERELPAHVLDGELPRPALDLGRDVQQVEDARGRCHRALVQVERRAQAS